MKSKKQAAALQQKLKDIQLNFNKKFTSYPHLMNQQATKSLRGRESGNMNNQSKLFLSFFLIFLSSYSYY